MKKIVRLTVLAFFILSLFAQCGPKPYYKTAEGKRKQKYYNDIQFGRDAHPKKTF